MYVHVCTWYVHVYISWNTYILVQTCTYTTILYVWTIYIHVYTSKCIQQLPADLDIDKGCTCLEDVYTCTNSVHVCIYLFYACMYANRFLRNRLMREIVLVLYPWISIFWRQAGLTLLMSLHPYCPCPIRRHPRHCGWSTYIGRHIWSYVGYPPSWLSG